MDDPVPRTRPDGADPTTGPEGGLDAAGAPSARDQELEDIVAEFIYRREGGEDPTIEEYLGRYPKFAEELAFLLSDESGPLPPIIAHTVQREGAEERRGRIGPYEILERIADGGGGTVFRARHHRDHHIVALKVLDRLTVGDPRDFARFQAEASMLRSMDLVNVVPVYETGEDRGRLYIAMKWIEGETLVELREAVKDPSHRLHDLKERARLVGRVARAFGAIHKSGIIHRDVKPSNIVVDRLGEPMIIDFGIARAPGGSDLTMTSDGPMGTPRYLAPELLDDNDGAGPAADVYGLGLCLYELVCGVVSFVQRTRSDLFVQIQRQGPLHPRRVSPEVPHTLAAVVLRSIEIQPERRYPTMEQFADDLDRFARGEWPESVTMRRAHPVRRLMMRHARVLPWIAAAVAALAIGGGWWWRTRADERRLHERVAELEAELPPPFTPRELRLVEPARLAPLAAEVVELAPDRADLRLRASWVAYLAGDYGTALSRLEDADRDDGVTGLWSAYLELLLETAAAQEGAGAKVTSTAPDLVNDEGRGRGAQFEVEVRRRSDLTAEEDRIRRRLMPPPLKLAQEVVEDHSEEDSDDPKVHSLRALIVALSVPSNLDVKSGRRVARAVRKDATAALEADASLMGMAWLRGLLALRFGNAKDARQDLARVANRWRSSPEAAFLHALAHVLSLADGGDADLASAEFARADARFQERAGRDVWTQEWARAELQRKFHGWWALHELGRGRLPEVRSILGKWRSAVKHPGWQDRLFPELIRVAVAIKEQDVDAALAHVAEARKIKPGLALVDKLEAGVRQSMQKDTPAAMRLLRRAARAPQQAPKDLQSYLRGNWFGVRPYSRQQRYVSNIERIRTEGR